MAAYRRRNSTGYKTFGSVAYAPAYDGNAVRAPRREEERHQPPQPKQREHVRRKALERAQVQVRQAGQVAPFAVIGFLAVAVFAVMLVMSYAQLTVANAEMTALRGDLADLQGEHEILTAQYERVFDLATLEAAVGDTMIRPTNDQIVYIDLSEPDAVTVYGGDRPFSGLRGMVRGVSEILDAVVEYFR